MITTSKLKIGNMELIAHHRFILQENEQAEFYLNDEDSNIRIVLNASPAPPRPGEMATANWEVINGGVRINFSVKSIQPIIIKGTSSLGSFDDGSRLYFYAEVYRYAQFLSISLQLMKDGGYVAGTTLNQLVGE